MKGRFTTRAFVLLAAVLAGIAVRAYRAGGDRRLVLETAPAQLHKWGRHFIVGFDDFSEVEGLVARGAVGGIFLRAKNVQGRSIAEIREEIDKLQAIQKNLGLPPLLVAADQEGGSISRMSPPLSFLPSLASILRRADVEDIERAAEGYGELQGSGLARLGANLNFSPVVDLGLPQTSPSISTRALSDDPETIRRAATAYARGLQKFGVLPTLKHFPGLGHFREDTHKEEAVWNGPVDDLENRDWIPFRETAREISCAIMLGHVRLTSVDPDAPVSISKKVIQEVIRSQWGDDALLITDDIQMAPIRLRRGGIGAASVQALNAGADLILSANGLKPYFTGMRTLLEADEKSGMIESLIASSAARLDRFFGAKKMTLPPSSDISFLSVTSRSE